jgi:hypothetical protein
MSNFNITKIERISSGLVKLYNGSRVVGSFSGLKTMTIGIGSNNRAESITFIDNMLNVFAFTVYNLSQIVGKDKTGNWTPIDPTDTSGAYEDRVYEIYEFLCDFIYTAPTEINITDSTGDIIDPSTDESVILLRRISKLLEPMATQDANQRQRIAISSVEVGMPVSSYGGVDSRFQIVDWARTAYNTGIRSNLIFS